MAYNPSDPFIAQGIVSYLPGSYTPGAESALAINCSVINATWTQGLTELDHYNQRVDDLTDDVTGWMATHAATPIAAGNIAAPALVEPPMTLTDTSTALVFANFNQQAQAAIADLKNNFATFVGTWFPNEVATYTAAESYLVNAINNATSGAIPDGIKAAILASGRAEIIATESRALEEATIRYASMRHALPPGALAGASLRVVQGSQDAEAALVRSVAIKDFDLAEQRLRAAVQMALSNRASALTSTREYIMATVNSGYEVGDRETGAAHGAQAAMLNAVGGFFSSRVSAAELALKSTIADVQAELEADKSNQNAEMSQIDLKVKAFLAQAQALAALATSLLNNIRAGAGSSYNVSA